MAAYIARRLIWVVFLLFMITLITFVIFTVLPSGDPAVLRAGRQPSPELIESIRHQFGLDKPKTVQFVNYIGDILPFLGHNGFYFGFSYQNQTPVLPEILDRLPNTIFLTAGAVILWLSVGIPIGMISAVKTGSWLDRLLMSVALIFISAPAPAPFVAPAELSVIHNALVSLALSLGIAAVARASFLGDRGDGIVLPAVVVAPSFPSSSHRCRRVNLFQTLGGPHV